MATCAWLSMITRHPGEAWSSTEYLALYGIRVPYGNDIAAAGPSQGGTHLPAHRNSRRHDCFGFEEGFETEDPEFPTNPGLLESAEWGQQIRGNSIDQDGAGLQP